MAMMRASSGAVGELSASSPLLLDDPECSWRVATGRVDLFAVEFVRGEPRGRRHALGTVLPGGALFGLKADGAELALLAVGPTGTRLERLDELQPDAHEYAVLIEGWAELLAGASRPTITERAGVLLRAGQPANVEAGAQVASLRGAVWIQDATGLALNGVALAGALPLAQGLVLEALANLTLRPVEGGAAVVTGAGPRQGLQALGTAVLAGLGREIASAGARERAAVKRRKDTEREETERVYASLGRAVDPRGGAMAAPGEDPVVAACRIAGEPLGIEVTEPPRLHGESVAVRLREVARSSAFRIREVALADGWWRHDVGPLVGVVLEGERPVATRSWIRLAAPARRSTAAWRRRWLRSRTCRTRVWDAPRPTVAG